MNLKQQIVLFIGMLFLIPYVFGAYVATDEIRDLGSGLTINANVQGTNNLCLSDGTNCFTPVTTGYWDINGAGISNNNNGDVYVLNGSFAVGTTTPRGYIDFNNEKGIEDVAYATSPQFTYGGGACTDNAYFFQYYIYAYKTISGVKVFSKNFADTGVVQDAGTTYQNYIVSFDWATVPDAEGYRVIVMMDNCYGAYQDYYFDTTATNAVIDGGYDYVSNQYYNYDPVPTVTPKVYGVSMYVDTLGLLNITQSAAVGETLTTKNLVVKGGFLGTGGMDSPIIVEGQSGNPLFAVYSGSNIVGQELTTFAITNWYTGASQGGYVQFLDGPTNTGTGNLLSGMLERTGYGGFFALRTKGTSTGQYYDSLITAGNGVWIGHDYNSIPSTQPTASLVVENRPTSIPSQQIVRHSGQTTDLLQFTTNTLSVLSTVNYLGYLGLGTTNPVLPLDVNGSAIVRANLNVTNNITGNVRYGELSYYNDTGYTLTLATQAVAVNLTNGVLGLTNGFSNVSTYGLKAALGGKYLITYRVSFHALTTGTYDWDVTINGVRKTNCVSHANGQGTNADVSVSANCILSLATNDILTLAVHDDTNPVASPTIVASTLDATWLGV